MPEIAAAVDVGSNAMRMAVGSINGEIKVEILENARESVRLGQDVFKNRLISEKTTERAVEAFIAFRKILYKYGIKHIRAVGTSALREAANRDVFIDRIARSSDIYLQVIGPEEEARLVHLAVSQKINLKNKSALLIDLGGGSVETVLVSNGGIFSTESFDMGSVRLLTKLEEESMKPARFHHLVQEYVDAVKKRIKKMISNHPLDFCIGTGGNLECLGDLRKELFGKNGESITSDELETIIQKLQEMSFEQRMRSFNIRADRADVIFPAAIIIQKIMKITGTKEIKIPRVGLKDGILLDIAREISGKKEGIQKEQIVDSALQLGRKYLFDEPHAKAVANLSLQIFDFVNEENHFNDEARLILEVSALLHDIGHFINSTGHHKHGYYILNASPIIGLSAPQRAIAANVIRYHRKSSPTTRHEGYRSLPLKDQLLVAKLAAILRIAEALDTEHAEKVKELKLEHKKPYLTIEIQGNGDLLLEKWAILKRAALFEEVYGVKIAIQD
ncbi:MAG: Ppx/GppA family phosphatase [Candidatus Eremiobacteraeota bacterium]|jgi:exopolyphosphatase/guanosine-5'-triphosphate,3'-diphosphate pyrophosphatase|nr:Ppx/GppA family phosphatase [Candidatus Eremiobacteraeota bacterium]MCL5056192.1 Ppx/GppA family phosphatase [Bacillota bacterium]